MAARRVHSFNEVSHLPSFILTSGSSPDELTTRADPQALPNKQIPNKKNKDIAFFIAPPCYDFSHFGILKKSWNFS
jgi:hypothetical protein